MIKKKGLLSAEFEIRNVPILLSESLKEWQRPAAIGKQPGERDTPARTRWYAGMIGLRLLHYFHCASDLKGKKSAGQTPLSGADWLESIVSLEFALQYPCPLRARHSEAQLRRWGRLSNLHTRLTTGDTFVPTDDKIKWVEEAREEIELMQAETTICPSCPASLPLAIAGEGEAVGCLGRITYPIEAQFEKFLADRVQLILDTVDQIDQPRLLRILVDSESPFDGEAAKELRRVTTAEGLRFFELRLPIALAREAARITTDNLFDLLGGFHSDQLEATSYTRELPPTATADYYDFLDLLLRNDLNQSELERLKGRSRNYEQYLRLLTAIEQAEALEARVLLD